MPESNAKNETLGFGFEYTCVNEEDVFCAELCTSLDDCGSCGCAILRTEDTGGPWGDVMDVIFALLPILVLVVVTVKKCPWPTTKSLPFAALMLFLIRLMYYGIDPILTCGSVILGMHEAIAPITIIAGAMTLFETMEATKCMPYMMREMKALTNGHPVAECMLIFCFAYMIEGASGFGTPVALGAPMLISTGHPKFESVMVLLIFNTFATVWGAVGTPIWFGFAGLATEEELLEVSYKAGLSLAVGAFILVPICMSFLVPFAMIKKNIVFVFLSLLVCVAPSAGIAVVSYEFPALIGGMVGSILTALMIRFQLGLTPLDREDQPDRDPKEISTVSEQGIVADFRAELERENDRATDAEEIQQEEASMAFILQSTTGPKVTDGEGEDQNSIGDSVISPETRALTTVEDYVDRMLGPRKSNGTAYATELIGRTFPIWGVVILLILTRIPQFHIKPYLTMTEPYFEINLNTYGVFRLSASLVLQLNNILSYPNLNWKYELLYIPFVIPFLAISVATMFIYRKDMKDAKPSDVFRTVASRLVNPFIALLGALSLVQLLIKSHMEAPAYLLGTVLADWFRQGFVVLSPLLGALGSFFSGSTTVSNLTFGTVQVIASEKSGFSKTSMLAMQVIGASAGNSICLNNIIAACTITGLAVGEGQILGKTYKFVLSSTSIATIVMLTFFIRFK
mmetsp:Transcript_17991/g.49941  ORF Transcript_17991/g.49941 Transcript_17991/m.49941 type:complete len:684 (+) Transcript_17991:105-2156(+)|eukprot:CAMPEP_0172367644 /NCGR_PEP_ID=MMETSP1060-20121228/22860_1 /TAXON_ID=37318 /ORGANISM="Pseudo-nitzschia pungens, Strain cf. cingulata" /LENGTH=683 /DNA_ID=CAMNT_0013091971 /DNA_START=48 /DNA_END=2099 /DNA_ORIENTATION=+